MSNNPYFSGNNFTFQSNLHFCPFLPPPPPPPNILCPSNPEISDHEYIKRFENNIPKMSIVKPFKGVISLLRDKMICLTSAYRDIQIQQSKLVENINNYTDEEWKSLFESIDNNKNIIANILEQVDESFWDLSRRALAKRTAKRSRLKRLSQNKKKEKQEYIKKLEEKSRMIDENLKKINDDIKKAKMEEVSKQQADIVLKDVLKKRHEAKKNISKLDALIKLRHARQNTSKGRGENICETETDTFQEHIEKLKLMWIQKLTMYDMEETELRSKLNESKKEEPTDENEMEVLSNLSKWQQVMFGCEDGPQVDFKGDVQKFLAVRSEWDRYISSAGTPLPLMWVVPEPRNHD